MAIPATLKGRPGKWIEAIFYRLVGHQPVAQDRPSFWIRAGILLSVGGTPTETNSRFARNMANIRYQVLKTANP